MQSRLKLTALTVLTSIILFACAEQQNSISMASASADAESVTEGSPDTALSDQERVIIKTANLSMDVDNVEESVQDFQQLVNKLDGHVFHYTLKNDKLTTKEVKASMDSAMLVHEIHPTAKLKVKIPVQQGDSFIQAVLNMNATISDFSFDENDVTETITEKKELMLVDKASGTSKAKSLDQQYFNKDAKEEYIRRKADFSKMAYQTKHLWFDVELNGLNYISKQMTTASSVMHTPFYVRASESLYNGWYCFSVFIAAVITVWPFILMGCILFFTLRSAWFKRLLKAS